MATEGKRKEKFTRIYYGWNPNRYVGPTTNILDTVLKPIPETKSNGNP